MLGGEVVKLADAAAFGVVPLLYRDSFRRRHLVHQLVAVIELPFAMRQKVGPSHRDA